MKPGTPPNRQFRIPLRSPEIAGRKERFAELNRFVTERQGWLTSIPAT
jgi:hypothetical protein